jgi:chromosome segregation ATPase
MAGRNSTDELPGTREKSLSKKKLAERLDALSALSDQIEIRSSGLRRDLRQVEKAQAELAATASRLAEQIAGLSEHGNGLEQRMKQVAEANLDLARQVQEGLTAAPADAAHLSSLETRLEDLARGDAQARRALSLLQERIDAFDTALGALREQAAGPGARVDGLVSSADLLQSLDRSLDEIRSELDQLIRRLGAMEAADAQDTALLAMEDRVDALDAMLVQNRVSGEQARGGFDARLASLEETLAQLRGAAERGDRLGARLDDLEGLTDRVRGLQEQLGAEGVQGLLTPFQQAVQGLRERLDRAASDLAGLRQREEGMGRRLDGLADLSDRVSRLEADAEPLEQRMGRQEAGLSEAQTRLRELGDVLAGLTRRVEEQASGAAQQAEQVQTQSVRLDELVAELGQTGVDLSSMVSRLEGLQRPVEALALEVQEAMQRIVGLGEGHQRLHQSLTATQDRFVALGEVLDTAQGGVDAMRGELRSQDQVLSGLRKGDHALARNGLLVALVLAILSVGGYLYGEYRLRREREAVAERLQGMERQLAGMSAVEPEQVRSLSRELRTLRGRMDDLPAASGTPPEVLAAREQRYVNLVQALDALGARLARVEDRAVPAPAPVATVGTEPPAPVAAEVPAAGPRSPTPVPPRDRWQLAQASGGYTVQLLGVRDKASLLAFARRHRLLADSAWYRSEFQGKPWLVLFHGIYSGRAEASKAAAELDRTLTGTKPWPRSLPESGELHPLQ